MTSRAEYRLLLRQDNADRRLRKKGYEIGLISEDEYQDLLCKEKLIDLEISRLKETKVGANKEIQSFLERNESMSLKTAASLAELICRPELNYAKIEEIDTDRAEAYASYCSMDNIRSKYLTVDGKLSKEIIDQVEIEIKYEGYIVRQKRQVEQYKKLEKKLIPTDLNYDEVPSLRLEARQKLKEFRPVSLGQASRISGVSPADVSVLHIYLERHKNN